MPTSSGFVVQFDKFIKKIPRLFLGQSSGDNENHVQETKELIEYLDESNFTVTYCGKNLSKNSVDFSLPFREFLFSERLRFEKTEDPNLKLEPKFFQYPTDSINMLITLELIDKMKMKNIVKIKVHAKEEDKLISNGLRIQRIEYSGACLNSKYSEQTNYFSSIWEPKFLGSLKMNGTDFMGFVIDSFPFSNNFDNNHFAKDFFAQKYHHAKMVYLFKHDIEHHMKNLASFYKIEKSQQKIVLADDHDHIVFKISRIFEKSKNESVKQVWDIQIEAIFNVDNDQKWKITRMFIEQPLEVYNVMFKEFFEELRDDFAESMKRDIESIASIKNDSISRFSERIKNANLHEDKVEMPAKKYANNLGRLLDLYRVGSNLKFKKCQHTVIESEKSLSQNDDFSNMNFQMICKYQHVPDGGQKVILVDFFASYGEHVESIYIKDIYLRREYDKPEGTMKPFRYEKSKHDFFENINELIITQSSLEYKYWNESFNNLTSCMKKDKFTFSINGHEKEGIQKFSIFSQKRRRMLKMIEKNPLIVVRNYDPLKFTIDYIFTHSMGFWIKETYDIEVEGGEYTSYKHLKIIEYKIKQQNIYRENSKNFDSNLIQKVEEIILQTKIDENIISKNFSAIIEDNTNVNEVLNFESFKKYLSQFLANNRVRSGYYDGKSTKSSKISNNVLKIEMVFDKLKESQAQTKNDEWRFLIKLKNDKIEKIIMSPPFELIV